MIQETSVKEDNFDGLVNHIVEVNHKIQKIMWRGELFTHIEKYKALKSTLKFPNHQGILDSVWNNYPNESKRTYIRLVLDFILAYVNWILSKTHSLAYGISIRKGKKPMAGIPFFPKFKYELPLEIKINSCNQFLFIKCIFLFFSFIRILHVITMKVKCISFL